MNEIIKEAANKLEIVTIGISRVTDYSHLEEFLISRKNKDLDCEFEDRDIKKRIYAKKMFPELRTIIAIGLPYGEGYKISPGENMGLLSLSSHGEDYHRRVNSLLNKLAEEISRYTSFKFLPCVDTSHLIDKEVCRLAGLGNYGKNSLLINDDKGSFVYLGYLLTDIEAEADTPIEKDICGTCSICMKSCPNKAIAERGGINPRRCVSYLTQTKTYIPLDYREKMGRQIYGCDICQLVCPLNRKVLTKETKEDYSDLLVDLKELLNMSNKAYRDKYGHMAGSWRGRDIWKRNALISIGNLNLTSMIQDVKAELENPSDMIKIYAAWALLKISRQTGRDILYNNLKYENVEVKKEYLKLLEAEI